MSVMLNSMNIEFAVRRVSVFEFGKAVLSKSPEECTSTFLRSREALGNFRRKDNLTDSNSNLVDMLLFSDFRIISATLSCIMNAAVNRSTVTAMTRTAIILNILRNSLIFHTDTRFPVRNQWTKVIHLNECVTLYQSRNEKSSLLPSSEGNMPFLNILALRGPISLIFRFSTSSIVPSLRPTT